MLRGLMFVVASATSLTLAGTAFAESSEFCHEYAAAAVLAAAQNLAWHCNCTGQRWWANYAVHYAWCLNALRSDVLREATNRHRVITECNVEQGDVSVPSCK